MRKILFRARAALIFEPASVIWPVAAVDRAGRPRCRPIRTMERRLTVTWKKWGLCLALVLMTGTAFAEDARFMLLYTGNTWGRVRPVFG